MASPIALKNTDVNVNIAVDACDNRIEIELSSDDPNGKGSATVFLASGNGFSTAPNATIPLSNYLRSLKALNPTVTNVVLTVNCSNFGGGGAFSYSITGAGVSLPTVKHGLPEYTSQMDSYRVNLH